VTPAPLTLSLPATHPVFAGHFPAHPVLPGALLLDLLVHALADAAAGDWQVLSAKFLQPVGPGERLQASFSAGAHGLGFELRSAGRVVASGRLARGATA